MLPWHWKWREIILDEDLGWVSLSVLLPRLWWLNGNGSEGPLLWDSSASDSLCPNCLIQSSIRSVCSSFKVGWYQEDILTTLDISPGSLFKADWQIRRVLGLVQCVSPLLQLRIFDCAQSHVINSHGPSSWTLTSCYYEEVLRLPGPLASCGRDPSLVQRPKQISLF